MNKLIQRRLILIYLSILVLMSCQQGQKTSLKQTQIQLETTKKLNQDQFIAVMQKHLDAVSDKDIIALESTMSPNGNMQLILPNSEIIDSVDAFLEFHREWFNEGTWTFETKILNTEVGDKFGYAVTEIIYREPDRAGKPYFNRMIVSYDLEKINGKWYVVKDHASSVEKSTDQ